VAAQFNNSTQKNSADLSLLTKGEGIVVDIGTGDGRFVYAAARQNPNKFFIGIDANAAALKEVSMKATRKPAKGGLPNVLFLQAAVESLPDELNSVADEIHIHFPWGSLLRAVATGDAEVLQSLRRIGEFDCLLEIIIGIDEERDRTEIERLGLPPLTADYLQNILAPRYEAAGFKVVKSGVLSPENWAKIETSWARKLQGNTSRKVVYFIVQKSEPPAVAGGCDFQ
jgi:16S rRNA (adenine(1408)-N(1))-methyltransferase